MIKELEELKRNIEGLIQASKLDVFTKEDIIKGLERLSEKI
jgi:hypothetical protein